MWQIHQTAGEPSDSAENLMKGCEPNHFGNTPASGLARPMMTWREVGMNQRWDPRRGRPAPGMSRAHHSVCSIHSSVFCIHLYVCSVRTFATYIHTCTAYICDVHSHICMLVAMLPSPPILNHGNICMAFVSTCLYCLPNCTSVLLNIFILWLIET